MNLKLGILAILLSTLGLGGALYLVINSISSEPKAQQESKKETSPGKKDLKIRKNPTIKASLQKPQTKARHGLKSDKQIIEELTALSDADLAREYASLAQHIKGDAVFEALENKSLSAEKAQQAKASLERFTLLGLESTRRKYVSIEPELKDPLYAHRDSLKDIRHILNRY